jgi:hypothetical protein
VIARSALPDSGPEMRMMATPDLPAGVASAKMVVLIAPT